MTDEKVTFYGHQVTFYADKSEVQDPWNALAESRNSFKMQLAMALAEAGIVAQFDECWSTKDGTEVVHATLFAGQEFSQWHLSEWIQTGVYDGAGLVGGFQTGVCYPHAVECDVERTIRVTVFARSSEDAKTIARRTTNNVVRVADANRVE